MSKIVKVGIAVLLGSSVLMGGSDQMKMYDVKSGDITYKITGSSDMMGMKLNTVGKKRVIFDNYGIQNLTEENNVVKQTMSGKTKTTKTHTMVYMKNSMIYTVDFESKRIMRMENMAAAMGALMGGGKNMKDAGEEMMKRMGGKKTGTDKVLGYTCDVWNLMGTKQCIYKGIVLKVETNMMGIINTEIATKAEFDISFSKDDFKLPDFPIYDMQGNKLDKSKLDAMDKQAQVKAVQTSQDMADLGKRMAEAAKSTGIKKGERPTKAQGKEMENAMMSAMLPMMKKKFLSQEKVMRFGKECFSEADTLKEANECNYKANTMGGEQEEDFDEWSPQMKTEILGFIDQGLQGIECIKKAQTMDAVKQCMLH